MACGCGKTTPRPPVATTTAASTPAPIAPLGSEPELVSAGK
ncbi:MAG: hypothetical protein WAM94_08010 [Chromatiaceae bacterium]